MLTFFITLLLVLHDSIGVPSTVNDDFPQMEFPQTVFDNVPYHLKKPSRVLDPFSEDVKTNFQTIENSKNSNKASSPSPTLIDILAPVSNKDGSITDVHNVEYVPFEVNSDTAPDGEGNNFKSADYFANQNYNEFNATKFEASNLSKWPKNVEVNDIEYLEKANQDTNPDVFITKQQNIEKLTKDKKNVNLENSDEKVIGNKSNEETEGQAEVPVVLNESESFNRRKRSPNDSQESECLENISEEERLKGDENETSKNYTKSTTTHDFRSSEVVLPRPPLATDYDDGIVVEDFKESNEETLLAVNCLENCVIEETHENDDHNEDF